MNRRTMPHNQQALLEHLQGEGWCTLRDVRDAGWGVDSQGPELISFVRTGVRAGLFETMGGDSGTFMVRAVDAANPPIPQRRKSCQP